MLFGSGIGSSSDGWMMGKERDAWQAACRTS